MKKKLLAYVFALTFLNAFSQTLPSYVPASGLAAYYPFNGNANDVSGNGNNGVNSNSVLTTDRLGNSNSAYDFNFNGLSWDAGLHQEIYIPYNNSFNSASLTVSMWVYPRSYYFSGIPGNDKVSALIRRYQYTYNNPNGGTWAMDMSNNTITCSILSASTNINQNLLSVSSNIQLNQWYHIIFTYDNSYLKLYLNGILVSQTPSTIQINTLGNSGISIGDSNQANGYWYESDAIIDDIGLWNRVLTQDEITNLYYADTVCQTLVINTGVLSFNPVTYNNTVTIYPNPANSQITIDCGNLANVSGWNIKITNTLGQEVFSAPMNTQQYVVQLNTWTGTGMYFVKIYNSSGNIVNTKKIILQ